MLWIQKQLQNLSFKRKYSMNNNITISFEIKNIKIAYISSLNLENFYWITYIYIEHIIKAVNYREGNVNNNNHTIYLVRKKQFSRQYLNALRAEPLRVNSTIPSLSELPLSSTLTIALSIWKRNTVHVDTF